MKRKKKRTVVGMKMKGRRKERKGEGMKEIERRCKNDKTWKLL
jgi:hypothetical protein